MSKTMIQHSFGQQRNQKNKLVPLEYVLAVLNVFTFMIAGCRLQLVLLQ